jgi:CelD/BcsL family acetyltransferase involved in cellulose biosynthesis
VPPGRAVVARLSLASEAVAVLYGFVTEGKFDFYQSGVRTGNTGLRSPGNLSHLLLMRALAERGVTAYDFLQGAASYKRRLATRENRLVGIEAWRPNARTAAHRLMRMIGRMKAALRRIICRLRRRLRTPSVTAEPFKLRVENG